MVHCVKSQVLTNTMMRMMRMVSVRDYSWDYTMIRKSLLINTALAMITMIMMIIMLTMKLMVITPLTIMMIASLFCLSHSDLAISLLLYCH